MTQNADLAQRLAELRRQFLATIPERIRAMEALCGGLAAGETAALAELHRQVHSLAGAGGTFGAPEVSAAARPIELSLKELLDDGRMPDAAVLATLGDGLSRVERAARAAAGADAAIPVAEAASTAATLLCVEDDAANLRMMEAMLSRKAGLRVLVADTPAAGLDLARSRRPDLILMDIHMPGMNGYELLALLRAEPDLRRTPTLAVTGATAPEELDRMAQAGFCGVLVKPFRMEELFAAVDRALAGRVAGAC